MPRGGQCWRLHSLCVTSTSSENVTERKTLRFTLPSGWDEGLSPGERNTWLHRVTVVGEKGSRWFLPFCSIVQRHTMEEEAAGCQRALPVRARKDRKTNGRKEEGWKGCCQDTDARSHSGPAKGVPTHPIDLLTTLLTRVPVHGPDAQLRKCLCS
jgi:hypothetical protein